MHCCVPLNQYETPQRKDNLMQSMTFGTYDCIVPASTLALLPCDWSSHLSRHASYSKGLLQSI